MISIQIEEEKMQRDEVTVGGAIGATLMIAVFFAVIIGITAFITLGPGPQIVSPAKAIEVIEALGYISAAIVGLTLVISLLLAWASRPDPAAQPLLAAGGDNAEAAAAARARDALQAAARARDAHQAAARAREEFAAGAAVGASASASAPDSVGVGAVVGLGARSG